MAASLEYHAEIELASLRSVLYEDQVTMVAAAYLVMHTPSGRPPECESAPLAAVANFHPGGRAG